MATDSQNNLVPGVGLPPEVVDDILAAPQRRAMLECLADAEDGLVMDDLVACVRNRETTDDRTRKEVRTALYDNHLPRLTATGLVSYDSMRERVTLTAPAIVDQLST